MVDLGARVLHALSDLGAPVFYAYPQKWVALPVISFFEAENGEQARADDAEILSSIAYTIDIWAKSPEETHVLGARVNAAMQGLGFTRDSANDLFEPYAAGTLHHRNMRYAAIAPLEEE